MIVHERRQFFYDIFVFWHLHNGDFLPYQTNTTTRELLQVQYFYRANLVLSWWRSNARRFPNKTKCSTANYFVDGVGGGLCRPWFRMYVVIFHHFNNFNLYLFSIDSNIILFISKSKVEARIESYQDIFFYIFK